MAKRARAALAAVLSMALVSGGAVTAEPSDEGEKKHVQIIDLEALDTGKGEAPASDAQNSENADIEAENALDTGADEEEQPKRRSKYLRHVSGWGEIEGDAIYTTQDEYVFYLDGNEWSADTDACVVPLNATDQKLSFSSSDPEVVTVDENGVISASNHAGSATVYMSTESGLYKECKVEVRRAVTGVTLSDTDLTFYADRPTERQITANVTPWDATNKEVSWKSSDTSVAGVDEHGVISTCGVGTAVITATTKDGGFKAQCTVRSTVYDITVKGVFVNNPIDEIPIGQSYRLGASVLPESARDKGISWSSDNPNCVSVGADGTLTAYNEGTATITARANNGVGESFSVSAITLAEGEPFEYTSSYASLEERKAALAMPVNYANSSASYSDALHAQMRQSPVVFTTNSRPASQAEVEKYLNPANSMRGAQRYQFLDLRDPSNVSERMLNVYLSNKGVLKGMGKAFRDAAVAQRVNAAYLAVHACLESGGGTSELARGVEYNGKIVYNMFGIGAYDSDPVSGGAKYAYEHGWFSVESAVLGGAQWISENYINAGQNTLYKMKWNPNKPSNHQYATDVAWASKQAKIISAFMDVFPIGQLSFEVSVYAGSERAVMKYD